MTIIYHSRDMDGFTSGAICKHKFPEAQLVGFDYGEKIPYHRMVKGESIIMIDVSVPMHEMMALSNFSNGQLTWIDHHKSAIEEYNKFFPDGVSPFVAVLQDGIAACEIGWKYLVSQDHIPTAVQLIGEYDTWRRDNELRWKDRIYPFQFGIRAICNSPETFPESLLNSYLTSDQEVTKIIENGKAILKYQDQVSELTCRKSSFEFGFDGLKAICLNTGGINSEFFKSVYDEQKHDIMMPFQFNGKFWVVSLYTTKPDIDCSVIAKKWGGGGHKAAAGFQVTDITKIFGSLICN